MNDFAPPHVVPAEIILLESDGGGPGPGVSPASKLLADGHRVHRCDTEAALWEAIASSRPDLILIRTEGASYERHLALARALARDSRTTGTPLVFFGARASSRTRARAFAAGAADYVCLPVGAEELRARLAAHVGWRRLRATARVATRTTRDEPAGDRCVADADLAAAFRHMPDAVGISRLGDDRYLEVSDGFTLLTGWSRDESIGRTALELGLWLDPHEQGAFVTRMRSDGEVRDMEVGLRRKDGATFTGRLSGKSIGIGETPCVIMSVRDVSERLRAEAALRESETRHREAERIGRLGHWDYEVMRRRLRWSAEVFNLYGVDPAGGEPDFPRYRALLSREDRTRLKTAVRAALVEGKPYAFEHSVRRGDGTRVHLEARGVAQRDATGRVAHLWGTVADVTERWLAEVALRESEARFQDLAGHVQDVFWILGPGEGRIEYVNQAFEQVWGQSAQALMARAEIWRESIHRDDRERVFARYQALLGGMPIDHEYRIVRPDGEERWIHDRGYPIRGAGGAVERIVGVAKDITDHRRMQAALREVEMRSQIAVEGTGLGIFDWNIRDRRVFYSDRWKTMLDYTPQELTDELATWEGLCHPDDLPRAIATAAAHLEGWTPTYLSQHRLRAKDGSYRWVEARGQVVARDAAGEPLRMIGTQADIHQSKLDQERIERLGERLQLAVGTAELGVWEWDMVANVLIWDDRMLQTWGYRRDEFQGTYPQFVSRVHREDVAVTVEAVERVYAGGERFTCEFRVVAPGREPAWQYVSAHVARDANGVPVRMVGVNIDTTAAKRTQAELESLNRGLEVLVEERTRALTAEIVERRRAEAALLEARAELETRVASRTEELSRTNEALRASEQQLAEAQRIAGIGRWEYDFQRETLGWSSSVFDILHADRATFRSRLDDYMQYVHPEDRDREAQVLDDIVARHVAEFDREVRMLGENGAVRWIHTLGRVEFDADGAPLRAVGTLQDVTRRKQAEEALKELNNTLEARVQEELGRNREKDHLLIRQSRLAAMGEMIGNIAHQWRQPLNALGLMLANIEDAFVHDELTRDYLHAQLARAQLTIQGMSTTIEDFRNFFKPGRAKHAFGLQEVVRNALSIVEPTFASNDIRIELVVVANSTLSGFANEYTQVLPNLLSNSKDALDRHAPPGERLISITIDRVQSAARLRLRDNGGGIAAEALNRVFDPYFTTRESGTGIGLYMSKMIIESSMGGNISLCNVPGGAEVTILTPAVSGPTEG